MKLRITKLTEDLIYINLRLNSMNKNQLYKVFHKINDLRSDHYDIRLKIENHEYKHLIETLNRVCDLILKYEFQDIKKAPLNEVLCDIEKIKNIYLHILKV
jgi:hypothetical protein